MSEDEREILIKGLEKAEYNTLRAKAMRNEFVIHLENDGQIVRIPAREVFQSLYKEPVPTF